jgi:hypothetical protein
MIKDRQMSYTQVKLSQTKKMFDIKNNYTLVVCISNK